MLLCWCLYTCHRREPRGGANYEEGYFFPSESCAKWRIARVFVDRLRSFLFCLLVLGMEETMAFSPRGDWYVWGQGMAGQCGHVNLLLGGYTEGLEGSLLFLCLVFCVLFCLCYSSSG